MQWILLEIETTSPHPPSSPPPSLPDPSPHPQETGPIPHPTEGRILLESSHVGLCELERRLRERKRSGVKGEEEDREKGEEERGIIMRRIAFSKEKYCIEKD